MRLVDFLVYLLEAHAQTLQRLAALLGEERLLEVLESAGERTEAEGLVPHLDPASFGPKLKGGSSSPYALLESAVHDFKLSAVLEFHLWAYPPYRAFIESAIDLNSEVPLSLVDFAVAQAEAWVKRLTLPSAIGLQAERAAHVAWLKFRATVLRKMGHRPIGVV